MDGVRITRALISCFLLCSADADIYHTYQSHQMMNYIMLPPLRNNTHTVLYYATLLLVYFCIILFYSHVTLYVLNSESHKEPVNQIIQDL